MNWTVFGIAAYLSLALQQGLAAVLAIDGRWGVVVPRLELVLLTFVALFAGTRTTIAAWVVVGLLMDLGELSRGEAVIVGPYTLACVAGAFTVLQLRATVLRTHPLSMAFCTICAGVAVSLIFVGIHSVRGMLYGFDGAYAPLTDLVCRSLGALYTAVFALLLAVPLVKMVPIFGLQLSRQIRR